MMKTFILFLSILNFSHHALARSAAPENAELYFITPADGETVHNPVTIRFGLRNMGVAPAGTDIENTGHHHLVIDADLPDLDKPVPSDKNHIHFGKGQTETSIHLEPGEHTLQLLLGDHTHIPHQPPLVSEKITITVKQ